MSLAHVSRPRAVAICSVSALLLVITALCLAPQAHATTPVLPQFTAAQSVVPTATQLYYPYRVAVDASGNVYISDTDANEVLKESPSQGVYTETVIVPASGGLSSPFGIAVDSSGNVYVVDNGNNRVVKETPSAGSYTQSVVATSELNYPTGIAVDASGNLYIADTQNGRLLKETPSSDSYTETVVGNSGLPQIVGVAVDSSGNLYCNDVDSMAIYEFTYSEGSYTMSTLSISGLNYPWDVAVDSSDNLYIDDNGNSRVLKETYSSPGNYTQSVVPTYNLGGSLGLAVDASGDLYLADTYSMNVKELAVAGGNLGRVNLTGAGQIAMLFDFVGGSGTVSVAGTLVVTQGSSALDYSDSGSGTCTSGSYAAGDICAILVNFAPQYPGLRLGAAGLFVGSGMSAFGYLQGVGSGPEVNFPTGTSVLIAGTAQPFGLSDPYDSAVDASGNVYIVDNVNNAVYMETLTSGS